MKERVDRQAYYRELMDFLLQKFCQVQLDPSKNFEVLMPEDRIDIFFELNSSNMEKLNKFSPFPYFAELNLVHIKAYHDPLQKHHLPQYLHQLYGQACTEKNRNKTIMLMILTANEPAKSIFLGTEHPLEKTELHFVDKIKADYPVYLFVLDRLTVEEKYWYFVPFFPLEKLEREKERVLALAIKLAKSVVKKPEYQYFIDWFIILQNTFYKRELLKEVEMALGHRKEVLLEAFPTLTKQIKDEGKLEELRENILSLLEIRLDQKLSPTLRKKVKKMESEKDLKTLFKKAALVKDIKEFEQELNQFLNEK